MRVPKKGVSTKLGLTMKVKDIKKLERLAAMIAMPLQKLLDQDPRDLQDTDEIVLTEKTSADIERAWEKYNAAGRKFFLTNIKKKLGPATPQRVFTKSSAEKGVGESKSKEKVTSDAKGSTTGP